MSRRWKVALILVAVVCFAVALSYPVRYSIQQRENDEGMARLAAIREAGRRRGEETAASPDGTAKPEPVAEADRFTPDETRRAKATPEGTSGGIPGSTAAPEATAVRPPEDRAAARAGESTGTPESATSLAPDRPPEDRAATWTGESTEMPESARSLAPEAERIRPPKDRAAARTGEPPEFAVAPTPEVERIRPPEDRTAARTGESTEMPESATSLAPEAERIRPPKDRASTGAGEPTGAPAPTVAPTPTPDRRLRTGKAQPYPEKEKVVFDEADILPEFQELYAINPDLVGWITIPGTVIDYPIVQTDDSEFYLDHDFYGEPNNNGQIILDAGCDPYTPSYHLVVSGHNMKSGSMFGSLVDYANESYWKKHKTLRMDVLTRRREYVVFAAFFSADYDVDEEGFRYNADIQYRLDMETWLEEIRASQLYDTGIDVEFGDEFLTLTTCNRWRRRDGRFVLVCRRIREGEEIE